MLLELWMAAIWYLYSYNGSQEGSHVPHLANSTCPSSCLLAESILTNMFSAAHEQEASLEAVKCSFSSFLLEMCWNATGHVDPETPNGNGCKPSVGDVLRTGRFYKTKCLFNHCFALFAPIPASFSTNSGAKRHCSDEYESLLKGLMRPDCSDLSQGDKDMNNYSFEAFKRCVQKRVDDEDSSCKRETLEFINNFSSQIDVCKSSPIATPPPPAAA